MSNPITWTDETWNPIVGCSKISEGCENCYAERMAKRLKAMGLPQYQKVVDENGWTGERVLVKSALEKPYHWKKPRKIFVGSMTDIFHESVEEGWLSDIMIVMMDNPQHTFQLLTKRADLMYEYFWGCGMPSDNVWVGVTVENQKAADERIPFLLEIYAKVRFVSAEPMLGCLELHSWLGSEYDYRPTYGFYPPEITGVTDGKRILLEPGIDWVICGGESGPRARPLHPDWVRSLSEQCYDSQVPFHFKQWGEWSPDAPSSAKPVKRVIKYIEHGRPFYRVGKKKAGRKLDGKVWDEFPEDIY